MNDIAPTEKDNKNIGIIIWSLSLTGFVIPFGDIILPLILWVMKKEQSPFINQVGKNTLNFNISLAIYAVILVFLMFIPFINFIAFFAFFALGVVFLWGIIMGIIKTSNNQDYKAPLTINLIK